MNVLLKSLFFSVFFLFAIFIMFLPVAFAAEGAFLTDEKTTMRLYPEADEGTNNWTATSTCSANHYDCVNETSSDGDGTYIETASSSTEDRFHVQDIPWSGYPIASSTVANQILRIELYLQVKDPTCSPSCGSLSAKIKNGSTMYAPEATTTKALTSSYAEYWFVWMLKPPICSPTCNDTNPWTISDLNNIVVSPYCASGTCRVTQMEVNVVWQRMPRSAWITATNTEGVLRKIGSGLVYSAQGGNNLLSNQSPDWDGTNFTSGSISNGTGLIGGLWKRTGAATDSRNNYLGQTTGDTRTSFVAAIANINPSGNNGGALRFKAVDGNDYLQAGLVFSSTNDVLRIVTSDNSGSVITDSAPLSLSANTFYLVSAFYDYSADWIEASVCAYDLILKRCSSALATATTTWANTYDENTGYLEWSNALGDATYPVHVGMAQVCSGKDIAVTGLPDNYSARLYNDDGTLIASSTEATGARTITLPGTVPCVNYFSTINIYNASSALVYQTHISNDIVGGDSWQWVSGQSLLIEPTIIMTDNTSARALAKGVKTGDFRVKYRIQNSGDLWSYTSGVSLASSTRFTGTAQLTNLTASTTYE